MNNKTRKVFWVALVVFGCLDPVVSISSAHSSLGKLDVCVYNAIGRQPPFDSGCVPESGRRSLPCAIQFSTDS